MTSETVAAEDDAVLARIVEAVASYQGIDGLGPDWAEDSDEPALIALLVLDALGLEQVGVAFNPGAGHGPQQVEVMGVVLVDREPIYRLALSTTLDQGDHR